MTLARRRRGRHGLRLMRGPRKREVSGAAMSHKEVLKLHDFDIAH